MNRYLIIPIFTLLVTFLMSACTTDSAPVANEEMMMVFQETEPGTEPFFTRMLVSKSHMRLNEGDDSSDYTLLDRDNQLIYTVTHGQKRIMQISPRETENKIEQELVMDAKKLKDSDIPEIEGQQPMHYQLKVNDKVCSDVYVIKDFSPLAESALREFSRILSSIHLANMHNTPVEMLDDCFLAHDVKASARHLQFGFPILQRNENGSSRLLVDYDRNYKPTENIFKLPDSYRMTDMSGAPLETS